MSASKTVYAMLEECSRSMAGTFSQQEILSWFRRHYPDARESTISAHIQATTSNAPNREQNHPSFAAHRPLFDRISHGVYRVHQANPQTPAGADSRASAAVKPLVKVAHRDPGSGLDRAWRATQGHAHTPTSCWSAASSPSCPGLLPLRISTRRRCS